MNLQTILLLVGFYFIGIGLPTIGTPGFRVRIQLIYGIILVIIGFGVIHFNVAV